MSLGFIFTISILNGQSPAVIGMYSHTFSCIALTTQGCKMLRDGQFFLSAEMVSRIRHQGGSGIRMLDRGPVGWLPLESQKKKNGLHQFLAGSSFVEH